jgi:hypothetical protein
MLNGTSTKKIYLYQFLTLGCYFFYWCSHSRKDINRAAGTKLIPSTWLLILPLANYWWAWRYANALEFVSYNRVKASDTFLLYIIGSSVAGGVVSVVRYLPSNAIKTTNLHSLIIAAIILGIIFLLLGIAGLGFFCAMIQNKINAIIPPLTATPPPSPIQ